MGRNGGVALPPPSVYVRCLLYYNITPNRAVQHKALALYTHTRERERKEQKRDGAFINALREIVMIVPVGTIILHYDTLMKL